MIEMGLVVGIALLILMAKMSWYWKLKVLSNPLLVDLLVLCILLIIHWGTFSGVMVATIGALVCSLILSAGRKTYGHIEHGDYIPGYIDISKKLN